MYIKPYPKRKIAAILRAAAKLLETTGWGQARLYRDGAYCAVGAIQKVLHPDDEVIRYPDAPSIGHTACFAALPEQRKIFVKEKDCPADNALFGWNDNLPEANGKDIVIKRFRQKARELEHGGRL